MTDVTAIHSFGQAVSSSALFVAEVDEAMHTDVDGNVKSTFDPGEEVFFLLHHDPSVKIKSVKVTDGADIQRIGTVTRSKVEQLTFQHAAHQLQLSHNPASAPAASWYGNRSSTLVRDGRLVTAPGAPVLGDISYSYTATQYLLRPLAGLTIAAGETFPAAIIIEWEES